MIDDLIVLVIAKEGFLNFDQSVGVKHLIFRRAVFMFTNIDDYFFSSFIIRIKRSVELRDNLI